MSDSEKRLFGSSLDRFIASIVMLTFYLTPALSYADPFLLLQHDAGRPPAAIAVKDIARPSVTIGLNEHGDLAIRHSDVSLIVAYNPPNNIVDHQERIRIAQRQESPAISGISLTVNLLF